MHWVHNGNNTKSVAQVNELINDIILAEGFNAEDLWGDGPNGKFSAQHENKHLDVYKGEGSDDGPGFSAQDGWKNGTVVLCLPGDRFENVSEEDVAPKLEIKGLWYCSLVDVIKSAFAEAAANHFHLQPFKLYWQDPDDPNAHLVRLFSELYNSDAFLKEHSNVVT
jgi:hypothetical protein